MKLSNAIALLLLPLCIGLAACGTPKKEHRVPALVVTVAPIQLTTATLTDQFICQIHSHHHIKIRTIDIGYLEATKVKEGQMVKRDDLLFQINYKKLFENKVVPDGDTPPVDIELEKVRANAEPRAVNLSLTDVKAPFDGMVNRLPFQTGSLVPKGETLTTLSDNSHMWAYFNVPEARYFELRAAKIEEHREDLTIELLLANGQKFDHTGKLGAIAADFDMQTGTISFRADFPNPDNKLRHGQTGTLRLSRMQKDAIVVPARATIHIDDDRYVYVVDKDDVAHRREIVIQNDLEDRLVVKSGIAVDDMIVIEGVNLIRDGEKVKYKVGKIDYHH